jgi:hypothetical protein
MVIGEQEQYTITAAQPGEPVTYDLVTRLVLSSREPYKTQALSLSPGQPLRLCREPGNRQDGQAVRVDTLDGRPVGYLSADLAGYLSILLDRAKPLADSSTVERIIKAAPPDDPAARRLRYPRLFLHLRLHLASAWPFFVIAAVLGLKTEDFAARFNLAGNPWLAPLNRLHERYLLIGHDRFALPPAIARAWHDLTQGGGA